MSVALEVGVAAEKSACMHCVRAVLCGWDLRHPPGRGCGEQSLERLWIEAAGNCSLVFRPSATGTW